MKIANFSAAGSVEYKTLVILTQESTGSNTYSQSDVLNFYLSLQAEQFIFSW